MTKVFKIEIMVVDTDHIGEEEVKSVIQNSKYPNWCISPQVMNCKSVEVDWSDETPLNNYGKMAAAYRDLFPIV